MKRPCPHGRGGANDRTSRPLALFMSPRGQGGGGSPKRRRTRKQPLLPFAPAAEENLVRHGAALQPLSHLLRISLLLCAPAPSSARGRLPRPRKPPPLHPCGSLMFGPPRPFLATPRQALPSPAPPSHAPPCRATPRLDLPPASCPVSPDPSIADARVRSIRGFPAPRFFGDRAFFSDSGGLICLSPL